MPEGMLRILAPFFDGTATPMVAAIAAAGLLALAVAAATLRRPLPVAP
jgi:hypothetical protein